MSSETKDTSSGRPNVDPRFIEAREQAGTGKRPSGGPPRDDENKVSTPTKIPRAPKALVGNPVARKKWKELAKTLIEGRTLGETDFEQLEAHCLDYSLWSKLNQEIGTELTIETTAGNTIQNPKLSIRNQTAARLQRSREQLGMTPVTRSKITKTTLPGQGDLLS